MESSAERSAPRRQLSVAWGITPMLAARHGTTDEIVWFAVQAAVQSGVVRPGDVLAVLVGSPSDLVRPPTR